MKFSLHQFLKAVVGLVADNHAAGTVNGPGIDRVGFEEALVVVNSGANGTSGTADVKVQESDDNSTWADVAGAQALGMRALMVRTGKFRAEEVEGSEVVPDAVVDSVASLPDLLPVS